MFLAVTIEEGDVDPAGFVSILKFDDVSFVKKVGIENDSPVLPVRDGNGVGLAFLQKCLNLVFVLESRLTLLI